MEETPLADRHAQAPEPVASRDAVNKGLWSLVKEALHGSEQDLTQLPLGRAIFLLAVPMVLEMCMESVFAVVDVAFVGRLGAEAVATVGLTEGILTIIYAAGMGLSIGATAMVARRIGEKDAERAGRTAVQAIGLGVIISTVLAVAGIIFARPMMEALGGSPWVLEHGVGYTRVMMGGVVSILLLFLINAIFRGAGDAAIAMRVLMLANGLNIVLAPCLIFGWGPFPEMGVVGAAWATTLGRSAGVVYQLFRLVRSNGRLQIRREHVSLEPATMLAMLRLSSAGMVQALVTTSSWVVLVRIVSSFGSTALAGYTIAIRIVMFALLPAWGLGNAAATLLGQSMGAGDPERGAKAVWLAGKYNLMVLGTIGVAFFIFAHPLLGAFTTDAAVVDEGATALRIFSLSFLSCAYGMVITSAFNGAGDTRTPTLIDLGCLWVLELPLAWVLAHPVGLGSVGAYWAVPAAFALMSVLGIVLFRRGRWKTRVV
ncbi:MATE family efflux transporter [Corallococcus exiguus]|uniref:MATE family efflux transporter n=3 Tax=Corallococcus TaxID=83461 RepID=UPI000EA017C8|nr:MATE family efflux transporter [Corallococcus sp. AB018]NNC20491.1 MATE family efflux transporter [Corallococcus exiguus]RKH21972.1 MATE family efflux transporter [Corallococcus sp. CA041A]RKI02750.1 MATE family efflux transporter [Corallococcus sp. AB030]NRD56571.1 MATE family efflux transporter [Corallococcus exiguus]RUO88895.1 MATE family efflux transporter [Corallococcus sp. AB018]